MKKLILILLAAGFTSQQSQAQISVSRTDFGSIGDVVYYGHDSTASGISVGSGGPNKTWDFSTVAVANYYDSTTFMDPANMAGAPSGANIALKRTNVLPDYFYMDNSEVKVIVKLDDYGVDNQSVKITTFPFTYLSSLVDSAKTQAQGTPDDFGYSGLPYDSIRITIDIKTTSLADGWGTLKIATETYNALRVKNVTNVDVTIEGKLPVIGWTPLPINLDRRQELYAWYGNNKKYSLAEAALDTAGNITEFSYQVTSFPGPTGVKNILPEVVKNMYPNPANDQLTLELKSDYKETMLMEVMDITGKVVATQTVESTGGITNAVINTLSFTDGMYMARFSGTHTNGSARFMVKH